MSRLSKPLDQLPSFMSAIRLATQPHDEIIKELRRAEIKTPAKYEAAKQHFISILRGDFSYELALAQARKISDRDDRKCALEILEASKSFLKDAVRSPIDRMGRTSIHLTNDLELDIGPIWIRRLGNPRLMVLYFWEKELSVPHLKAASAAIEKGLMKLNRNYENYEIDFITVSKPSFSQKRMFQNFGWNALQPLSEEALDEYFEPLCKAWSAYKKLGPREIRSRKRNPTLFD